MQHSFDHDEDLLLAAKGMRRRVEMPLLLTLSMGWYSLIAVASILFLAVVLRGVFQNPAVSVEPSPPEAFTMMGVLLAVVTIEGAVAASITYALWHERPVSRNLVMWWWAVTTLPTVVGSFKSGVGFGSITSILLSLFGLTGAWWYLYRKPSVIQYFQVLTARKRHHDEQEPSELQGA